MSVNAGLLPNEAFSQRRWYSLVGEILILTGAASSKRSSQAAYLERQLERSITVPTHSFSFRCPSRRLCSTMIQILVASLWLSLVSAAPAPAPAPFSGSPASGPDASVPTIPVNAGGPVAAPPSFSGPTCVFTIIGTATTIGSPAPAPSASSSSSSAGGLTTANISCTGGTIALTGGTSYRPFSGNFVGDRLLLRDKIPSLSLCTLSRLLRSESRSLVKPCLQGPIDRLLPIPSCLRLFLEHLTDTHLFVRWLQAGRNGYNTSRIEEKAGQ